MAPKTVWFTPEDNDIIIPVLGPTGAGKSTFINYIAGKDVTKVGHDLKSCTTKLSPLVIEASPSSPLPSGRRLVLVDTHGFNDANRDDAKILRRVDSWLETMYGDRRKKLAGMICLHDISLTRNVRAKTSPDTFEAHCALPSVVLCSTKWSNTSREDGERRTEQLRDNYWKEMVANGSTIHKFEDSRASAWEVVTFIIDTERNRKM